MKRQTIRSILRFVVVFSRISRAISNMQELFIRPYHTTDEQEVIALWVRCHLVTPRNNPQADIARKLKVNPELFLVGFLEDRLIATCMAGYEGHRGWINYLAVSPEYQRQGFARQMMAEAERRLHALGCPKINLQIRASNTGVIQFYQRLGYNEDQVVSFGKRLIQDAPYRK